MEHVEAAGHARRTSVARGSIKGDAGARGAKVRKGSAAAGPREDAREKAASATGLLVAHPGVSHHGAHQPDVGRRSWTMRMRFRFGKRGRRMDDAGQTALI